MKLASFLSAVCAVALYSSSAFSLHLYSDAREITRRVSDRLDEIADAVRTPPAGRIMQKAREKGAEVEGGAYLYYFDDAFVTLYDCNSHPIWSAAFIGPDQGNVPRTGKTAQFYTADDGCAPRSAYGFKPYKTLKGEVIKYHRGHLISFNSMDGAEVSAVASNSMVNVTPQSEILNTGAYRYTEYVEECYREQENGLFVVAGGIEGVTFNNIQNKHGIDTPEYIFKIIIRMGPADGLPRYQAWLFPNDNTPVQAKANSWMISINELQAMMNWHLPTEVKEFTSEDDRLSKPAAWPLHISPNGQLRCSGIVTGAD